MSSGADKIGGMILLGEQTIAYVEPNGKLVKRPLIDPTVFSTWGKVNDTQFLLGDDYGKLYMLSLDVEVVKGKMEVDIGVKELGKVRRENPLSILF